MEQDKAGNFKTDKSCISKPKSEISKWTKFGVRRIKLIKQAPDPISSDSRFRDF